MQLRHSTNLITMDGRHVSLVKTFPGEQELFEELRSPTCISTRGTRVYIKFQGDSFNPLKKVPALEEESSISIEYH